MFELRDEVLAAPFWLIASCEVVGSEFVVDGAVVEEMPADDQQCVSNCDPGSLITAAFADPLEPDSEVTILGAHCCPGCLDQRRGDPRVAGTIRPMTPNVLVSGTGPCRHRSQRSRSRRNVFARPGIVSRAAHIPTAGRSTWRRSRRSYGPARSRCVPGSPTTPRTRCFPTHPTPASNTPHATTVRLCTSRPAHRSTITSIPLTSRSARLTWRPGPVGANNRRRCLTCSKHNRSHLPDSAVMVSRRLHRTNPHTNAPRTHQQLQPRSRASQPP